MGNGGLGCVLSHIKAIELAKENNLKSVIILEDDVELINDFDNKFNKCFSELPNNWDLLYLSGTKYRNTTQYSENLYTCDGYWGTFGYVINSSIYDLVLNEWQKLNLTADHALIKLSAAINVFVSKDKLVLHKDGYSFITNDYRELPHLSKL